MEQPAQDRQAPTEVLLDAALWEQLSTAASEEAFFPSWMALQCRMIPGAVSGVVVLADEEGGYAPAAAWPEHARPGRELSEVAELAISRRQGMVRAHAPRPGVTTRRYAVAYPLLREERLQGVVGINVDVDGEAAVQGVIRQLKWGSAWLDSALRRRDFEAQAETLDRFTLAAEMVATAMDCESFGAAATAVTSELATRLGCERVSLGLRRGLQVRLEAISHSATFGRRMNLIRGIEAAMDEAIDQERSLAVPVAEADEPGVLRAHEALLANADAGTGAALTVPVVATGHCVGAMTFEWADVEELDDDAHVLCEGVAGLVGPLLHQRQREERSLLRKAAEAARQQLERLAGPGYLGRKVGLAAALATVLFFSFYTTDYRVTATARLEGQVQRVAAAPFDGYLAEAPVRAGDTVAEGSVLARLEDREIRLEREGWVSRRDQYVTQLKQARAERNQARMAILSAQIDEAEARIELADDRLSRTQVRAPFDAIVVDGDLSQSLGKSVRQGDVLFRLAPLEEYRVILHVDERDVDEVRPGQTGRLLLTGHPEEPTPFRVTRVTPVTVAEEGINAFVVEADLEEAASQLRPGMEGVAKVEAGERHLAWIWAHPLVDWLRLQLWRWWV